MTWTTVPTWTTGQVLTAAHLNLIGANLNETAPGKATTAGGLFVATGTNAIAERIPQTAFQTASETYSSTSYGNLATVGPSVTVTSGSRAMVILSGFMSNNTGGGNSFMAADVSGATTIAAQDATALRAESSAANDNYQMSYVYYEEGLTPGSNVFTVKYRVTTGTTTFDDRRITVFPF